MTLNASFGKLSGGIGGIYPLRGKSVIFDPYFVYPRNMGKTFLNQQAMQTIGRGLRGFVQPGKRVEYWASIDGDTLKQICRHISGKAISTNPDILRYVETWSFNVLVEHPALCDALLNLILIDQDMDELHSELWRTKNWSNKALHERTWNRAKEQLRQAQEDYEIMRRLTDPDCPYLVYTPKH